MISKILNRGIDKIESKIYGRRIYNLEINLSENLSFSEKERLWMLMKYTGSFIVTEKGYLLEGYDSKFEKRNAIIDNAEILPPSIKYKNGYKNQIINDFLGLRLAELKYQKEKIEERGFCFA